MAAQARRKSSSLRGTIACRLVEVIGCPCLSARTNYRHYPAGRWFQAWVAARSRLEQASHDGASLVTGAAPPLVWALRPASGWAGQPRKRFLTAYATS